MTEGPTEPTTEGTTEGTAARTSERTTELFVDAVEAGRARLLLGEEAFSVPAVLLPAGAREGSWIRLGVAVIPPPSDPEPLRRKLGGGDPGGPIKL
jgi:hypothetical protein